ncbi:MAG: NB-ARC domain-containing protein [Cyanobacteria bacterium J06621_11]
MAHAGFNAGTMRIETAVEYADQLLYERTGKHLSDLQSDIIQQSLHGKTYGQVAILVGYSEGHVKDVASQLWKILSEALGERITKGNLRSRLKQRIKRTIKSAPGSATVIAGIRGVQAQIDRSCRVGAQSDGEPADPRDTYSDAGLSDAYFSDADLTVKESPSFLGRQEALRSLQRLTQLHRILVIQGEGGIGKTTLAQQYAGQFDQTLELLMAKETENITPVESVVEEWLRQHFNEEPGREFGITLSRLKHHLHTKKVGVLIDNLEPALDGNGQFVADHRHYVELLRVLGATPATVLITSRDRLCEPGVKVHHYRLPGLTIDAWQQFFGAHLTEPPSPLNTTVLTKMHRAYAGNAKAMEILCAAAIEDFEGDLAAYWRENATDLLGSADLRNLVSSQVNRLQQLDVDAYQVFCRLGCYRYQDQPSLAVGAIAALMWDIDRTKQKQTINSLRDRSLIECQKGAYWLHPVSRAEAIARLRKSKGESDEWAAANQAAAQYWSAQIQTMTSVSDALIALEAFYHLIAIADYDGAAAVLLKSRHNQWNQFLPLASSLYRKGLLQPAINAITRVLPHVQQGRSELNNILGDVYWITGDVHRAIACQQQTLADTAKSTAVFLYKDTSGPRKQPSSHRKQPSGQSLYYLKMLTVDAHLSIGLYAIDLWELSQAAEQFEKVIALAGNSAHQAWADKATVGLSLVQAHLGHRQQATALANAVAKRFAGGPSDEHGRYAYFLQLLGQTFSQLGATDKAHSLYQQAIASAEAGHYIQVKAKALTGLAVLQRRARKFEQAIALHTQSIELCQQIGATCDQAEAYFQLSLTLASCEPTITVEAITSEDSARRYFNQAIAQFSRINAPKQIDRMNDIVVSAAYRSCRIGRVNV